MTILDYKGFFEEQQQGQAPYLHILSHAVATNRDAAVSADDRDKLLDALRKSSKQQNMLAIFAGMHQGQKVLQLNQLAYQSHRAVCLINCTELSRKYIGETEKNIAELIAQAEGKNWILYFDQADALFAGSTPLKTVTSQDYKVTINAILKYLSRYQGLSVFNIQHKHNVMQIALRSDYVIHFDN